MDSIPRAVKLSRETAKCADGCAGLVTTLLQYYATPNIQAASEDLVRAQMGVLIQYAKENNIETEGINPARIVTVEAASVEVVSQAERLMSLCNDVIIRFTVLRDMCGSLKDEINGVVEKPAVEAHCDNTIPYIIPAPSPANDRASDGGCVTFMWTPEHGKPNDHLKYLIAWDAVKGIYVYNPIGRADGPTSEHRSPGKYTVTYGDYECTVTHATAGIITGCAVNRVTDKTKLTAWCKVKPIKWTPVNFRKVFGREQRTV